MRTKRSRAAVVTLTVAGLLAAGTMAYADDDVENTTMVTGGTGGYALSGGNTASENGSTSGDANANGGYGGNANNYQNAGEVGGDPQNCTTSSAFTFDLLAAVQGVNVCPNVGPVASSFEGGDANGGSARSGGVTQTNNASSTAEANGGSAGIGSEKATNSKSKSKKAKNKHRRHH